MTNKGQREAWRHHQNANSQLNVRHVCLTRTLVVPEGYGKSSRNESGLENVSGNNGAEETTRIRMRIYSTTN